MDPAALRREFPVFIYDSFELEERSQALIARFRFCVPPSLEFVPEVYFEDPPESWKRIPAEPLRNVIFHLGLIELFSYWKATCSPLIRIDAGRLTQDQLAWWQDLLRHGMGEFFFHNNIDFTERNFVQMKAAPPANGVNAPYTGALPDRSLAAIGGGRDSALTAKLLQTSGESFGCMMLNPIPASSEIAAATCALRPVIVRRTIRPELLELNRRGFLNGHTPFSAYLAFLNAACLLIYGYSRIVVANERSSDEGNTVYRAEQINHQYSKTLRFEALFDEYLQGRLVENARYFSLVRPLYELQIAQAFARRPELFGLFRSCNRNQKQNSWCGECPKCVSVFITMYPFARAADVVSIFGIDLYANESVIPVVRRLAGLDGVKPFECVATTDEVIAALHLGVEKARRDARELPAVLQYASEAILPLRPNASVTASELLAAYGPHRLPPRFEAILTSEIGPARVAPQ